MQMIAVKQSRDSANGKCDLPEKGVLKSLVEDLQEGEILSIPLEGMVISDGQTTE